MRSRPSARNWRRSGATQLSFSIAALNDCFKPKVLDHLVVFLRRLALGGEVVADENGIGGIEPQGLKAAQSELTPGANPQLAFGIGQPE